MPVPFKGRRRSTFITIHGIMLPRSFITYFVHERARSVMLCTRNLLLQKMYKIMQFKNLILRHNLNFILSKIANETDYAGDLFSGCKGAKKTVFSAKFFEPYKIFEPAFMNNLNYKRSSWHKLFQPLLLCNKKTRKDIVLLINVIWNIRVLRRLGCPKWDFCLLQFSTDESHQLKTNVMDEIN